VTFDGKNHTCDHCGLMIERTGGHDWMGPISEPGHIQRHYHLSRDFPECRIAGGIDPMPGELESLVAKKLASLYTKSGDISEPMIQVSPAHMAFAISVFMGWK
jgi:hypothetical protein